MSCAADYAFAVELGQSVYEVVCSVFDAVVVAEVDDACVFGHGVFGQKTACGSVRGTAEYAVYVRVVPGGCESQVCLADESVVDVGDGVSGVVRGVYPLELDVRMVEQQSYEFAGGVFGVAYDCGVYHLG